MTEEEKGYEVVDKRKVRIKKDGEAETVSESKPEAPAAEAEQGAGPEHKAEQPEEPKTEEQAAAEEEVRLPPVDVDSLIKSFIGILGAHTWQWLGLVRNPVTGEIEKDLAQAKTAIDTISALASQIESKLEPAEQRELRSMLSDLQMNFVRQSSQG